MKRIEKLLNFLVYPNLYRMYHIACGHRKRAQGKGSSVNG